MRTKYRYRRDHRYDGAYDVTTRYGVTIGTVDPNGPSDWVAELHDGVRGYGRTRDAAVDDAVNERKTREILTALEVEA